MAISNYITYTGNTLLSSDPIWRYAETPTVEPEQQTYSPSVGSIQLFPVLSIIIDGKEIDQSRFFITQSADGKLVIHIKPEEKPKLAAGFFKRVLTILEAENITYDERVVAEVINKHFPDFRRTLNELQRYGSSGKIDAGILTNLREVSLLGLIKAMKDKNFPEIRKWAGENTDVDTHQVFRELYDKGSQFIKDESIPTLVVALGEYQFKSAWVVDQEINLTALLAEIAYGCQFK